MASRAEIDLLRVRQSGLYLKFAKKQTSEIVLAAVSENSMALKDVEIQTPEICLLAVSKFGEMLFHVKNQSPEITLAAVSQDGLAIKHANTQSEEVIFAAWKKSGDNILNLLVELDRTDSIEILLKNNVNIENTSSIYTDTPFQMAIERALFYQESWNTAIFLKEHGADINSVTRFQGCNVLVNLLHKVGFIIPSEIAIPIVIKLLSIGVDPNQKDNQGASAYTLAEKFPDIKSVLDAHCIKKLVESTIESHQDITPKKRQIF
jgi:hypothetical protein